jgi:hypothetical protein
LFSKGGARLNGKQRLLKLFSIFLVFCIIIAVLPPPKSEGKTFKGYFAEPTIAKIKGKPGETVAQTFTLFNRKPSSVKVKLDIQDFKVSNKQLVYKNNVPLPYSVAKWSSFNTKELTLKSNSTKQVSLNIHIPKNAEMGEHPALAIIRFEQLHPMGSGNVNVAFQILPVIYVTVTDMNGEVHVSKKWRITDFQLNHFNKGFMQYRVKNEGNVHLESAGTVTIRNLFTGNKHKVEFPRVNVLVGVSKKIPVHWNTKDWIGIYKVHSKFTMDGNQFVNKDSMFYVIPWIPVTIGFAVLIALVLMVWIYLRRLKKRMLEEGRKQALSEMTEEIHDQKARDYKED